MSWISKKRKIKTSFEYVLFGLEVYNTNKQYDDEQRVGSGEMKLHQTQSKCFNLHIWWFLNSFSANVTIFYEDDKTTAFRLDDVLLESLVKINIFLSNWNGMEWNNGKQNDGITTLNASKKCAFIDMNLDLDR